MEILYTSHSSKSGQNKLFLDGGQMLYEKWDHGVTTLNRFGRKVYKKFHSKSDAVTYMHGLLATGRWAIYWDKSRSPNFYYSGIEVL